MRTETFQLTTTSAPLEAVDRSGRQVVDFRAEIVARVSREGDEWEAIGPQPVHVRARGHFAELVLANVRAEDDLVVTGPLIEPAPGADLFDEDGPLPRMLATVVARPLD